MLLTSEAVRGDGSSTTSAYQGPETHHLLLPCIKEVLLSILPAFRKGKTLRQSISLELGTDYRRGKKPEHILENFNNWLEFNSWYAGLTH